MDKNKLQEVQLKNELNKVKASEKQLKTEIFQLKQALKDKEKEIIAVQKQLEDSIPKNIFIETKETLDMLMVESRFYEGRIKLLEQKNKQTTIQYTNLQNSYLNIKNQLETFNQESSIKTLTIENETLKEQVKNLSSFNTGLLKRINTYEGEIKSLKKLAAKKINPKISIEKAFSILEKELSLQNLNIYRHRLSQINLLLENNLQKHTNDNKNKANDLTTKTTTVAPKNKRKKTNKLVGYIKKENDVLTFFDLDNNTYEIESIDEKTILKDYNQIVCLAKINNNKVCITRSFSRPQKETLKAMPQNNDFNFRYSKKLKVLLLTSYKKIDYVSILKKIGLDAKLLDIYEHGDSRLSTLYNSSDIIVSFKNRVPHQVDNHINKEDPRVIILSSDNLNSLLSAINQKIHDLDLAILENI